MTFHDLHVLSPCVLVVILLRNAVVNPQSTLTKVTLEVLLR